MSAELENRLLAAHAQGDKPALVRLYAEAAEHVECTDAQSFFLTQAYVYALETNDPQSDNLRQRLVDLGRETP